MNFKADVSVGWPSESETSNWQYGCLLIKNKGWLWKGYEKIIIAELTMKLIRKYGEDIRD